MVNLSLVSGEFAEPWKPLTVAPHHKKGSRALLKNFRPVCYLVELGKIVERAVAIQMLDHLEGQELLHPNLHGGLGDLSPATAHVQLQEQLIEAVSNRELAAVLMIDKTAAYDLLDHGVILAKMGAYNLGESFLKWMTSYLEGRTQRTRVQAQTSTIAEVESCGAPQGSILAGLLHIVSRNDCPAANTVGTSLLFVYDQTDMVAARCVDRLEERAQEQPDSTCEWLRANRMVVAPTKMKLLLASTTEMASRRNLKKITV